jgi:glycosyltransferase involved in cell wall biosynthesis
MTRRALIVTYYFPPSGGIGYERTLKYATYLPESGWEPVVLTVRDAGYGLRDPESIRRIPRGLAVVRTRSAEPAKLRRWLGGLLRALLRPFGRGGRRDAAPTASAAAAVPSSPSSARAPRLLGGIWQAAIAFLLFPDEQVGWIPFARRAGRRIVETGEIDVVYSTSFPISSHVIAGRLARRAGRPWVADFRDPWIGNAFARRLPCWQRPLQRRLDRWIVRNADRIVFASDGFRDGYRDRYPWAAEKMLTIPNGYDPKDFSAEVRARIAGGGVGTPPSRGPFTLAYGGSVYGEHELEIFLDGVERLLARRPELRARLRVEFIGWLTVHNREVAARHDTPDRLAGIVAYTGYLSHDEAIERLARADALFHVLADEPGKSQVASGKLTEYVGLDKQVVAFVPEGSARAFLRELDWGILADPTPEGVADGIERAMAAPRPARKADPEGRYDRANLAARLAAVFDEVVPRDRGVGTGDEN